MYPRAIILLLSFSFLQPVQAQDPQDIAFKQIIEQVDTAQLCSGLYKQLAPLFYHSVSQLFDRDIDAGYRQQRIHVQFSCCNDFNIDMLTRHDSIFLAVVSMRENGSAVGYPRWDIIKDSLAVKDYLRRRNAIYHTATSERTLIRELSIDKLYAFFCGDGMPVTNEGKHVLALISNKDIAALQEMLCSVSCEMQAFAVAGFEMIIRDGGVIPDGTSKIIRYIKKRNTPLLTCSGCISGLEQIYSPK